MQRGREMRARGALALAVLALVAVLVPALAGTTQRVSVSSLGVQGNSDSWSMTAMTNGFVAFVSNASNLVVYDTNGGTDVFVRDLLLQTTQRVSVSSLGHQGWGGLMDPFEAAPAVAISDDGGSVAFASDANNLVPWDRNRRRDVFVRDWLLGVTERESLSSLEVEGNGDSAEYQRVAISSDGRYVAFPSVASNLVPNDSDLDDPSDVFVRDRLLGTTECVSVDRLSGYPAGFCHGNPAMSPDGRYVVFSSWSPNVVAGDANESEDVFLRDRQLGETYLISVDTNEQQADYDSYDAAVSADGRFVVFDSYASNLVPGDTNGWEDVFLRDRTLGTTTRISVSDPGEQGNGPSGDPSISADGRFVAFMSDASNLVPGDTNQAIDLFVVDLLKDTIARVSLTSAGEQTGGGGGGISPDGGSVCLVSWADDVVEGDTNNACDVFVRNLNGADTGLYDPATGTFQLTDRSFRFGPTSSTWLPIAADWDADTDDTIGLYSPTGGTFYLRNTNAAGAADLTFRFGPTASTWLPIAGDWNNDATDTIGLYDPTNGTFYLRNANSGGVASYTFRFGPKPSTWKPIAGDWNGDGTHTIGLYDLATGTFYLRNANAPGAADLTFRFGPAASTWLPIVGDWDDDGVDTIGLYDPANARVYLRNSNSAGPADATFRYRPKPSTWKPMAGDWDGR